MTFKDYNHSSKPLFYELNLLNVYQLNYFVIGNLMNQYSKKQLPAALMLLFKTNEEIVTRGRSKSYTRQQAKQILENSPYVIRE